MFDPNAAHYLTALVCEEGHLITDRAEKSPLGTVPFCQRCGSQTLSKCPSCSAPIRGDYWAPGVLAMKSSYRKATYCYNCSAPMPWTANALEAAEALAADLDTLSEEERETLQGTLSDLLADTSMTKVSAGRFKRLMVKAGGGAIDTFHDLLVDVMSEAAKKAIWG
jgi:hypothetical protein